MQWQDQHIADGFYDGREPTHRQRAGESIGDSEGDRHVKQDLAGFLGKQEHELTSENQEQCSNDNRYHFFGEVNFSIPAIADDYRRAHRH